MSDLLPCPFCGGPAELNVLFEDDTIGMGVTEHICEVEFVVVRCSACGISKEKPSTDTAIKWWNTRHPPAGEALKP